MEENKEFFENADKEFEYFIKEYESVFAKHGFHWSTRSYAPRDKEYVVSIVHNKHEQLRHIGISKIGYKECLEELKKELESKKEAKDGYLEKFITITGLTKEATDYIMKNINELRVNYESKAVMRYVACIKTNSPIEAKNFTTEQLQEIIIWANENQDFEISAKIQKLIKEKKTS